MSEKEHDRKCWNCEFDDFCSWTAAGEEDNGSHCPWNQEIHSG